MKKLNLIVIIILITAIQSCFPDKIEDDELLKNELVNPEFEKSPPLASKVFFEELDTPRKNGENIRVVAEFNDKKPESEFLAINLTDEKIVLRDDGKGADKVKGDNRFSVFIKDDPEIVKNNFIERQKFILDNNEEVVPVFKNRSLTQLPTETLHQFDFREIRKGELLQIPFEIFKGFTFPLNPKKTLMITDIGVVEDPSRTFNPCTGMGAPDGSWTFGELMRQMASPSPSAIASDVQASNFVRNWLNSWLTNQTVNGEALAARTNINNIITDWENKSGVASGGVLKMEFAPFKLMAIVNRLDLRGNSGYGFSNAGEGRLVFNALSSTCNPLQFTVIFEYGINKKSCSSVKAFAQEWEALNGMTLGSIAYNDALENITNQFTLSGTNTSKPNQNSINQIRTNEIALASPWELREFNLLPTGQLGLVTVKQEPAVKYNAKINNADVERLVAFINSNTSAIENNNYNVPEEAPVSTSSPTPTTAFLGGKSHTRFPPTGAPPGAHHWNGTTSPGPTFITSDEARHVFSLNTCSGCHGGETQTFFTHISPITFGSEATLSGFLTGITVTDAANRPSPPDTRTFNDLQRREQDLSDLINNTCINKGKFFELAHKLTFNPLRMTH